MRCIFKRVPLLPTRAVYFKAVNHLELDDKMAARVNTISQKSLIHVTGLNASYVLEISEEPGKVVAEM